MDPTNYAQLYKFPESYQPPDEKDLSADVDYPNLNSLNYQKKPVDRTPKIQKYFEALIVNQQGNGVLACNELVTGEWNGSLWGFDKLGEDEINEKSACFKLQCESNITGLRHTSDNIFAVTFSSGAVQLWSTKSAVRDNENYCLFMIGSKLEHERGIAALEIYEANNSKLVTGSKDGMIKIWDIGSADLFSTYTMRNAHCEGVTALSKDPHNASLFGSSSFDGRCVLWDTRLAKPGSFIFYDKKEEFTALSLHGQHAYVGTIGGTVLVVDRRHPKSVLQTIPVFDRTVRKIIFNGDKFGVIGNTNCVKVFSLPSLSQIYENAESGHIIRDLVWNGDNKFWTVAWDSKIRDHQLF